MKSRGHESRDENDAWRWWSAGSVIIAMWALKFPLNSNWVFNGKEKFQKEN